MSTKRQVIYFQLVIGIEPLAYCNVFFTTKEQAEKYWLENYHNRKKNDGHDEYWNNLPLMVQKVEKNITMYW